MWSLIVLLISTTYNSLPKMNTFYVYFHHMGQFDDRGRYVGGKCQIESVIVIDEVILTFWLLLKK